MSLNKYIQWSEIWDKEVCIQTSIDSLNLSEEIENKKNIISILKKFREDKEAKLMSEECYITPIGDIIFFFGEQGGENESDNQGWSRDYTITVDSDFMVINAEYSQG